ncbi:MAG: hypothetical protein IRZ03_18045, partial [Acidobacterium ailaaui]|nr:hypothetical protein [Pseudacidobacterium ailaaui]
MNDELAKALKLDERSQVKTPLLDQLHGLAWTSQEQHPQPPFFLPSVSFAISLLAIRSRQEEDRCQSIGISGNAPQCSDGSTADFVDLESTSSASHGQFYANAVTIKQNFSPFFSGTI